MLLGASPDDGIVPVGEHEADAHDAEVFADVDGLPAGTGLMHFTVDDAHHAGDGGAADIDIEDADLQRWIGGGTTYVLALLGETPGNLRGDGALADAALSGQDDDLVLDVPHSLADSLDGYGQGSERVGRNTH